MKGTVCGSEGGVYRILLDSREETEASLRGRLKKTPRPQDRVVIGDRVEVSRSPDGSLTIEGVDPRRTEVVRKGPGGRRPKVVAANVDRLLVVAAAARPAPRPALIDRLLVIGEANHLEPVLVFNKMDLASGASVDLAGLYRTVGYRVLETSAVTGWGMEELAEVLSLGTSALVGASGVGKSTLLNAIQPSLGLEAGELSRRRGSGKHTTVSARLIPLEIGGMVADTPGFSDVGIWGVEPRELERCFPEFGEYRGACRYRSCTHLHEPGCEVRSALERGEIHRGRFGSYERLVQEADRS